MDDENYYDYVVQIEELQKKLYDLKKKRSMTCLKEQLTTLNSMYHQIESNVTTTTSNLSQFNDSTQLISQILDHKTKISMQEECANNVKGVLSKISKLSTIGETESVDSENNVNKINSAVIGKVSRRLDCFKSNYNTNWMLVTNISKIFEGNKKEDDSTKNSNESKSRKSISDSLGSLGTFSETNLVSSSPIILKK